MDTFFDGTDWWVRFTDGSMTGTYRSQDEALDAIEEFSAQEPISEFYAEHF